ncbi:MAG: HAD family phosphatase [Planctomycetia bacterium]|nr:HAD family phosphatase [Planctomycetia bacterium]
MIATSDHSLTAKPTRAAIWDVDGTLVDTAELHFRAWERLCGELKTPFSRADFAATFGQRNPEIIPKLLRGPLDDAEIARLGNLKEDYYRHAAQRGVDLLPGVRPLLASLQAAGFRQGIGSSAPRANLELILELTQSAPYFTAVVAMEDTQRGKPDPEVFLTAAKKLGIEPNRCVVFEDAIAGVQAARAAGMKCVAVSFVGHHPAEKLAAAGAHKVVANLAELDAAAVAALWDGAGS